MGRELPSGTITILFSDVVGSTALTTARGDEPAHDIVSRQRELVRREIEQHSGHEVKTMGDGFMVVFASARQAVSCAIAIQRALERHSLEHRTDSVAVRIGLNTGEAIAEGADYFGAAVTTAERVMGKAAGGEIFVSDSVRAVLGPASDVRLADRGRFRLKGFPERARLFEVIWREAPSPAQPEVARTPFISRTREMATLRTALGEAAAGRGALVLIAGEPGVGKTRLAEEIAAEAQGRFVSFVGRCYEDTDGPPYGPFIEIIETAMRTLAPQTLRAALGESLPDVARIHPAIGRMYPGTVPSTDRPAEIARRQLFSSVRDFLMSRAGLRPILLTIDDLQWADGATLQLMRHLARMVHEMPALVVATFRDGPADVGSPFVQALDEWHRKRLAERIDLRPFTLDELRLLLRELNGQPAPEPFVRALEQETGGNAFFVEELLRHLGEEKTLFDERGAWRPNLRIASLPPGVRVVVGRRLDRLGRDARGVLVAAAVLGHTFDAEMTERVTGAGEEAVLDAVDRAERAGIIVPESEGTTWRFAHSLTRTVLLGGLTSSERQRLHRVAARALAERHGDAPERAAELARHYLAAGGLADLALTVDALRRAAAHAAHSSAYPLAASHLERALALDREAPVLSPTERADLKHEAGRALYHAGRYAESQEILDQADEAYARAADTHRRAEVLFSKAALANLEGRASDALERLEEAKPFTMGDGRLMTEILQLEAQSLMDLRMYARAAPVVDEALSSAERSGDAGMAAQTRLAAGLFALQTLDMPRAIAHFSSVRSAPGDRERQLVAESRCAIALSCVGQLDDAEERSAAAFAYFRRMVDPDDAAGSMLEERDPYEAGIACLAASIPAIVRGRFDEARAMLTESIGAAGTSPNFVVTRRLLPAIVQIHHVAGRFDEALQWIARSLPPRGSDAHRPVFARIYDALSSALRGTAAGPAALPAPPPRMPDLQSLAVTVLAAETAVVREDAVAAAQQMDAIRYLQDRGMLFTSGWVTLVPRLLGGLLRVCGDLTEAQRFLLQAARVAEAVGARPEVALTRLEMAFLDRAGGESTFSEAREHVVEARSLLTACGIRAHDRRLTDLAAVVDAPLSPRRASGRRRA